MKKIILYTVIVALICGCVFGLYSLNQLFKEKRIIKLLTNNSCKYWINTQSLNMGIGYCKGDTTVSFYKTRTGQREIRYSPTNWLRGDIGCICKWKYLGDSMVEDELDKFKIILITEDTLIRKWEKWERDTFIYDR